MRFREEREGEGWGAVKEEKRHDAGMNPLARVMSRAPL